MAEILLILFFVVVFKVIPEMEFHNYEPPKGQRIDYNAQSRDRIENHLTDEQVKYNTRMGKYNTKDFDFWSK